MRGGIGRIHGRFIHDSVISLSNIHMSSHRRHKETCACISSKYFSIKKKNRSKKISDISSFLTEASFPPKPRLTPPGRRIQAGQRRRGMAGPVVTSVVEKSGLMICQDGTNFKRERRKLKRKFRKCGVAMLQPNHLEGIFSPKNNNLVSRESAPQNKHYTLLSVQRQSSTPPLKVLTCCTAALVQASRLCSETLPSKVATAKSPGVSGLHLTSQAPCAAMWLSHTSSPELKSCVDNMIIYNIHLFQIFQIIVDNKQLNNNFK